MQQINITSLSMFGSLKDFIDVENTKPFFENRNNSIQEDLEAISPLSKYSKKNALQIRKRRTMSGVETYKASDKSLLFSKFSKNYPQIEATKKQSFKKEEANLISSRKPISQSKLSSLFYGQNPSKIQQQIVKDQYGGLHFKLESEIAQNELKRQHNLLRAVVRTKKNDQQKVTNTHYEDSFNRMSSALRNIKIKQIAQIAPMQEQQIPKTNRSLHLPVSRKSKSRLSNKTRLQFENCLNWSKKRNKNGSFYASSLGKQQITVQEDKNKSLETRRSILKSIHQRSISVTANFQSQL